MKNAALIEKASELAAKGIPTVMGIFPVEDDADEQLPFHYTVGMTDLGFPEVMLTGFPMQLGHSIVMNLFFDFKERGVEAAMGLNSNILEGYDVKVVRIANTQELRDEYMVVSDAYQESKGKDFSGMDVVQILWPNKDGQFPGELLMFSGQIKFLEAVSREAKANEQ